MRIAAFLLASALAGAAPASDARAGQEATGSGVAPVMSAQQLPLEQLLGRVQERYRTLRDLRCRFRQSTVPRRGIPPTVAEGDWAILNPGRLRIAYEGSGRLFVADGETIYWYLPEDHQVQVFSEDALDPAYTPTLYLSGEGDLREDFAYEGTEWADRLAPGNIQILLRPRSDDARFDHLVIEVAPESALIVRFVQVGLLGEVSEFRFSEISTDVGLSEDLFRFTVPADAQVETIGS